MHDKSLEEIGGNRSDWERRVLLPAAFVWFVTVLPRLYHRGAVVMSATMFAILSAVGLFGALALYRRHHPLAKSLALWGFGLPCLAVYVVARAPAVDPASLIAGFLGWALFAMGCTGSGSPESPAWSRIVQRSAWPFWFVFLGCLLLVGLAGMTSLPPRNLASIGTVLVSSLVLFDVVTRATWSPSKKVAGVGFVMVLVALVLIAIGTTHDLLALALAGCLALALLVPLRKSR